MLSFQAEEISGNKRDEGETAGLSELHIFPIFESRYLHANTSLLKILFVNLVLNMQISGQRSVYFLKVKTGIR